MKITPKEIEEIKTKLDDEQFLQSEAFHEYMERVVRNITKKYDTRVVFSHKVATNGVTVWVNPLFPAQLGIVSLNEKVLIMMGCLAHEIFHIEMTNFSILKKEVKDPILHKILNIIEDAFVENKGKLYYEGLFTTGINFLNDRCFKKMTPVELAPPNAPQLSLFLQAIFVKAMRNKDTKFTDDRLAFLFEEIKPILLDGIKQENFRQRLKAAKQILKIINELIPKQSSALQEAHSYYQNPKDNQDASGEMFQPSMKSSSGDADAKDEEDNSNGSGNSTEEEADADAQDEESSSGDADAKDEEDNSNGSGNSTEEEADADAQDEESSSGDADAKDEEDNSNGSGNSTEEEADADAQDEESSSGDADAKDEEDNSNGSGNSTEEEADADAQDACDDTQNALDALDRQLNSVKTDAAEDICRQERVKNRANQWDKKAKNISYSSAHDGIRVEYFFSRSRMTSNTKYSRVLKSMKSLVLNTSKKFKEILRFNEDQKISTLEGKIDKKRIFRHDGKIFYKRHEKSDEADLAILLAIDMSDSMSSDNKYNSAIAATILLIELCKELGIPIEVVGHQAISMVPTVKHVHVKDFDAELENKDALFEGFFQRPAHNTREGLSLRYCAEYLKQRPEKDKLLISISDGGTEHRTIGKFLHYTGGAAQKDVLKESVKIGKEGVHVIGVAIGDGAEIIKRNYQYAIAVPNTEALPGQLIKVISAQLLK